MENQDYSSDRILQVLKIFEARVASLEQRTTSIECKFEENFENILEAVSVTNSKKNVEEEDDVIDVAGAVIPHLVYEKGYILKFRKDKASLSAHSHPLLSIYPSINRISIVSPKSVHIGQTEILGSSSKLKNASIEQEIDVEIKPSLQKGSPKLLLNPSHRKKEKNQNEGSVSSAENIKLLTLQEEPLIEEVQGTNPGPKSDPNSNTDPNLNQEIDANLEKLFSTQKLNENKVGKQKIVIEEAVIKLHHHHVQQEEEESKT